MKSENSSGQRRKRSPGSESEEKPRQKKSGAGASSGTKRSNSSETKKRKGGKKSSKSRAGSSLLKWVRFCAAVLCILVLVCLYLFDISRVSSNAMMPALAKGDLVLSFAPKWVDLELEAGDIVLVDNADNEVGPNYLRVIDGGGAEIKYTGDRIVIDGKSLSRLELTNSAIVRAPDEPDIWRETLPNGVSYRIMLPRQALVGALTGQYRGKDAFLVGDNRMASYDSRQAGAYDKDKILGRALIILETTRDDGFFGSWIKGTGNTR